MDRYNFTWALVYDDDRAFCDWEGGKQPTPTRMERRWVSVGVPSDQNGLWVAECETNMCGMQETHNFLKGGAARVLLARTMDEKKREILKGMGATFYANLEQYDGAACVKALRQKTEGEVGPLVQTQYEEE